MTGSLASLGSVSALAATGSNNARGALAVTGTDGSMAAGLGIVGLLTLLLGAGLLLRRRRSVA